MRSGVTIMSVFATVWCEAGIWASGHASVLLYSIPLAISAIIVFTAASRPSVTLPVEDERRIGRVVGIASGLEGLLIGVSCLVLANTVGMSFVAPIIAIIVGLHFIPLARWLPERLYYATSALLVALGIGGLCLRTFDERVVVIGTSADIILWLTCIARLWSTPLPQATGDFSAR